MMFRVWTLSLCVTAVVVVSPCRNSASAGDLLAADRPVQEVVDHYIDLKLQAAGVTPAPQADDANLARRLYLDLAGRTPTLRKAQAFVNSTEPDKRSQLVRRLLQSPDFVRHERDELDLLLSAGGRSDNEWRAFLLQAARENTPWDKVFRELLLTEEQGKKPAPELSFVRERAKDIDRLTTDVSSLFFGVNISCAKCHDHPLVSDWRQDHFYGMQSFFNRTFVTKANFVAEHSDGDVKFKTTSGETKDAKLMFLTGEVVDEPSPLSRSEKEIEAEKEKLKELEKKKLPPPAPAYSRREQLVEVALAPEHNRFFSRSIVNRMWYRFFGHGLVNPVDQMHSANPPTHPELLDWLARHGQS